MPAALDSSVTFTITPTSLKSVVTQPIDPVPMNMSALFGADQPACQTAAKYECHSGPGPLVGGVAKPKLGNEGEGRGRRQHGRVRAPSGLET